jgi:hypothetical protein
MSNCLYCEHRVLIHVDAKTRWEPEQHRCSQGWALIGGEHGCSDYERAPGSDDDLSAYLSEPFPVDYPPETDGEAI